jgi:hypothetical protein
MASDYLVVVTSPSGMMVSDESFKTIEVIYSGTKLHILPPVRIMPYNWRAVPQISDRNIHKLIPGLEWSNFPVSGLLVELNSEGKVQLSTDHGAEIPSDNRFPDIFRLTVFSAENRLNAGNIVSAFLDNLYAWLRVETRQYWIGRSIESSYSVVSAFPIKSDGIIGHDASAYGPSFYVSRLDILPVTFNILLNCARRVMLGSLPTISDRAKTDFDFYMSAGLFDSAIILATSLIEIERDLLLERVGKKIKSMGTSSTDLLKHLSIGMNAITGRDLQREEPELFSFLSKIWIARGHLAHGKPSLKIQDSGDERRLIEKDLAIKTREILTWIASIHK